MEMQNQLAACKSRMLRAEGTYVRVSPGNSSEPTRNRLRFNVQEFFMELGQDKLAVAASAA